MASIDWKPTDVVKAFFASLATIAVGIAFAFATFATKADVERVYEETAGIYAEVNGIEVRLIKADIREIRRELRINHLDEELKRFLEEQLAESLAALCERKPDDKECR